MTEPLFPRSAFDCSIVSAILAMIAINCWSLRIKQQIADAAKNGDDINTLL